MSESGNSISEEAEAKFSAEELFGLGVERLLSAYSARQKEILRLAQYAEDRSAEIDNAKQRAHEFITQQVGEVDEDALSHFLHLMTLVDKAGQEQADDDLTAAENREAAFAAVREASKKLPEGLHSTYLQGVVKATASPPAVGLLRSSLLVALVGELEMMVNQLARQCFELRPEKLNEVGKSFVWKDISSYETIAEIRDAVVDYTVEDALRGSLTDWIEYFRKRFSIGPIGPAETFQAQEIIQRRHCIVHNAGYVSPQYRSKLSQFDLSADEDEELEVSASYLADAADTLFLVGYSLAWSLGFKLAQEANARQILASSLTNRVYYLLQEGRLELVKMIGAKSPFSMLDEESAFIFQVNVWLAYKNSGDFSKVKHEVEQLEVASKSRKYNLAKLALLDHDKEAYELANQMIRDDKLRPEFLYTWPLLSGARQYGIKIAESESA